MSGSALEVVGLGARCELVPPERDAASPGSASFDVSEFVVLSDGRRVTLHRGRGFSLSLGPGTDPWAHLTAESLESDVLTTVLPDDDGTGEEHPYGWLRDLLRERSGLDVPLEVLRAVPYVVELSDLVRRRLAAGGRG